ncbi:hypothetical protein ACET3Z_032661 [Daucus carota]
MVTTPPNTDDDNSKERGKRKRLTKWEKGLIIVCMTGAWLSRVRVHRSSGGDSGWEGGGEGGRDEQIRSALLLLLRPKSLFSLLDFGNKQLPFISVVWFSI